ncbi:hypothetical protein ACWCXX_39870 [Streptomyces sp. NPDC001732]
MPCYSIPSGSGLPEVAANFNHEVVTGLLRGRCGFDGVVCTDFKSLTGMEIPGIVQLPPRNWGVEHLSLADQVLMRLDAGVDQLGGETPGGGDTTLTDVVDLDEVVNVRRYGTAGLNRIWEQFRPGDPALELPLYGGRIDPATWNPATTHEEPSR